MALLAGSDLNRSEHWLWKELEERHRTEVQHAAYFALFDDVRPAWEAHLAAQPPPPATAPSELVAGLLAQAHLTAG